MGEMDINTYLKETSTKDMRRDRNGRLVINRELHILSWILLLFEVGVIRVAEMIDSLYNVKRNLTM